MASSPGGRNTRRARARVSRPLAAALNGTAAATARRECDRAIRRVLKIRSTVLYLGELNLSRIPDSVGSLTEVERVDLRGNRLTGLPESLGRLKWLDHLVLSRNHLTALPTGLRRLVHLRTLDLSDNKLTRLPGWLGDLTELRHLFLSGNQLSSLPDSLWKLSQLESLTLDRNDLTSLPESIGQLQRLRTLDVSWNHLAALPESLARLGELRRLELAGNRFVSVPECLERTEQQLHWLDLRRNQLRSVPKWIGAFRNLYLFVHDNPGLGIPPEHLGSEPEESSDYLSVPNPVSPASIVDYRLAASESHASNLRKCRLLVVGPSRAGKSSVVRRLLGRPLDASEPQTCGIVASSLKLAAANGAVSAQVFEFGGRDVYEATHHLFPAGQSLYLLVLDGTRESVERQAIEWLHLIQCCAGRVRVVVALNKSSGGSLDIDRAGIAEGFGPVVAWVATECNDRQPGSETSITALRNALDEGANALPDIRAAFSDNGRAVMQWLERSRYPHLSYSSYRWRCIELGECNHEQQEALAGQLNDLGIAVVCGPSDSWDQVIPEEVILRPDWLANGIGAVLRANSASHPEPLAPDACIGAAELDTIYARADRLGVLSAEEYPAHRFPLLLRLMTRLELGYALDEEGSRVIVPALFPAEAPAGSDEPDGPGVRRLRYELKAVPGMFLPRLLVRLNRMVEAGHRWRRGGVLRHFGARARVWATPDDRRVCVSAAGSESDRDELLSIVRATIESLAGRYQNLPRVEQWEYDGQWVPRATLERIGALPAERSVEETVA